MHRIFYFLLVLSLLNLPILKAGPQANQPDDLKNRDDASESVRSDKNQSLALKRLERAQEKYAAGKSRSAKRLLKKVIRRVPDSTLAAEALALRAQIHLKNEQWIKAFDDLQRIIDDHPQYENFDRIIAGQFECATALMEGATGRLFWIFPGFKQYRTAVEQFEQILSNAPYGSYAPITLMNIALISEKKKNSEEAIDALDRLINFYPQSILAPDAYYNLAKTYSDLVRGYQYDQGSTRRAISYYEDFLILFPNSEYIGEVEAKLRKMEDLLARSRLDLGDFYYYYRNNNTAALVFYNEAITIEPDSDAAEEARTRISDIERGVRPVSNASLLRKLLGAN